MSKRNDPSMSRARNRKLPDSRSAADLSLPEVLEDLLDQERFRLMQAHTILNCAVLAMEADDNSRGDGPHYPSLIEMARDLINESINRLDSVNLGNAKQRIEAGEGEPAPMPRSKYQTRESPPVGWTH